MKDQYRWTHALATTLACGAVGYQTAVIWESMAGVSLTTKLGIPLATVSAALLPVLAEAAWRGGERFKSALLATPVIALMAFVLPSGIARLGENQSARVVAATTSEATHDQTSRDLARAERLVAQSEAWVAEECASGPGKRCAGQTFTLNQRTAYRDKLKAALAGTAPVVQPWLPVWHPALLPIGLELAVLAGMFYGLGPLTVQRQRYSSVSPAPKRPAGITERDLEQEPLTEEEMDELRKLVHGGLKNKELAAKLCCSEGQSSKVVSAAIAAGKLSKRVDPSNRRAVIIEPA